MVTKNYSFIDYKLIILFGIFFSTGNAKALLCNEILSSLPMTSTINQIKGSFSLKGFPNAKLIIKHEEHPSEVVNLNVTSLDVSHTINNQPDSSFRDEDNIVSPFLRDLYQEISLFLSLNYARRGWSSDFIKKTAAGLFDKTPLSSLYIARSQEGKILGTIRLIYSPYLTVQNFNGEVKSHPWPLRSPDLETIFDESTYESLPVESFFETEFERPPLIGRQSFVYPSNDPMLVNSNFLLEFSTLAVDKNLDSNQRQQVTNVLFKKVLENFLFHSPFTLSYLNPRRAMDYRVTMWSQLLTKSSTAQAFAYAGRKGERLYKFLGFNPSQNIEGVSKYEQDWKVLESDRNVLSYVFGKRAHSSQDYIEKLLLDLAELHEIDLLNAQSQEDNHSESTIRHQASLSMAHGLFGPQADLDLESKSKEIHSYDLLADFENRFTNLEKRILNGKKFSDDFKLKVLTRFLSNRRIYKFLSSNFNSYFSRNRIYLNRWADSQSTVFFRNYFLKRYSQGLRSMSGDSTSFQEAYNQFYKNYPEFSTINPWNVP